MALPEIINFNGQQITRDAFMLMPCYTKEDLHNWIKLFVNIDFPDCTVSETSNSNPMDMIWWIYKKCVLDRDVVGSRAVFMAARGAFKTLGLSIAELLSIIHGNRDVAHIGAIETQATRCYSYFTKYMWQEEFKHFIGSDPTMKKTIFKTGRAVEIIPCSIAQVNGPHSSLVCIGGSSRILLDNTNKNIKNNNRQKILMSAGKLYRLIKSDQKINAISYNHKTQQIESQLITNAYDSGKRERLKIITNAKYPLWCTPDHKLFDPTSQEYKPAKDFKIGDQLVTLLNAPLDSKPKQYYDINSHKIDLPIYSKEEEFEQIMLGSMLGDGGVYRKEHSNAYYSENHGLKQTEYLNWKRNIISRQCHTRTTSPRSGYTGKPLVGFASGNNPIFNKYHNFKKNIDVFKNHIDKLSALSLAVWYMDDGYKDHFCSNGFNYDQHVVLVQQLKAKFDINAKIVKVYHSTTHKEYYNIKLSYAEDRLKFYQIVKEYMHPDLQYKLDGLSVVYKCKDCGSHEFRINTNNAATACSKCYNKKELPIKTYIIKDIIFLKTKRTVYDFTVAHNHNFFASGVLIKNCLDEVDTVRDMQAYRDVSGIPSPTMDGRPPVEVSISTRKSTFGLMQQEIDNAHKTNTQVFSWNVIDITKQCPDSRSLTEKVDIYVNFDTLEAIDGATFNDRPITEKINFEKRQGYKGCLQNCKCFAACLGNLKNQKSTSTLLRDIEYTQADIFKRNLDYTIAQLLCRKPSTEGTIYSTYSYKQNVKTFNQIYEIFMGEVPTKQITFEDLHFEFTKRGIFPYVGVDPGDQMAAILLIYIDGARRVYILKEQTFTATDDNELALWIKHNWGGYNIQMIYSDVANPSAMRLMIKQDLPVSKKVDKDVHAGISTVRGFLRIPGTNRTGLFIHENCANLIYELPRYHYKKTASDMVSKDPDKQDDHGCDTLRMVLHSIFGGQDLSATSVIPIGSTRTEPGEKVLQTAEGSFTKIPTAAELATALGIPQFVDNSADVIIESEDPSKKPLKGGGSFDIDWNF